MKALRLGALASLVTLLASSGMSLGGAASCAPTPDGRKFTDILQPDYPTYAKFVDPFIQSRCGTLDCHGQAGRAYRIYGYNGFRLYTVNDGGLISGGQPTTDDEVRANYAAAVSLEPEEMSRYMATQASDSPEKTLMLLRKPMKLERHKGGQLFARNDDTYRCILGWLRIRVVRPTQDGEAFETIPQEEREQLDAPTQARCGVASAIH